MLLSRVLEPGTAIQKENVVDVRDKLAMKKLLLFLIAAFV
jgi:hypothetical protein